MATQSPPSGLFRCTILAPTPFLVARRASRIGLLAAALTFLVLCQSTRAASATWNATPTNGNWVTTASENNWNNTAGVYPGATTGTTNQDIATFLTSNITTIAINSPNLNVKSINFGVASGGGASSYTIGSTSGNSLLLSSGGEIAILSFTAANGSNITETINAPLVLQPATTSTAGTYTFRNSSGSTTNSLVIAGDVSGGTTSAGITLTLGGTNTGANGGIVSGSVSNGGATGGLALTKNTSATWNLTGTGANTYSGKTTVTAGLLILNKTAGVNAIGSTGSTGGSAANTDLQITGGTVRLDASNQIIDSAKVGLSGGTLRLNGVNEGTRTTAGVGALSLSANSIIDLASTSLLHFAASNTQTWVGTLSIYNWTGTPATGGGTEALLFGTNTTSLTQAQLNQISFYSDNGTTFLGTGAFATMGDGEVVPVPEPSTWAAAAFAAAVIGQQLFARRKGCSEKRQTLKV